MTTRDCTSIDVKGRQESAFQLEGEQYGRWVPEAAYFLVGRMNTAVPGPGESLSLPGHPEQPSSYALRQA